LPLPIAIANCQVPSGALPGNANKQQATSNKQQATSNKQLRIAIAARIGNGNWE
jgi:hypothetical protein